MGWRDALLDALALLSPVECAGCGAPDRSLCAACALQLVPAPTPRLTPGGLTVVTSLHYEGAVRRVILALKEQDRTDVAAPLSAALKAAIRSLDVDLVPVPTSRAAYRRRGYDPVALLMRRASLRPVMALRHVRATERQKSLGVEERAANLEGAFAARGSLTGRRVLLVDDVLTTGATLDEAARAVREAGGEVVGGATLAFTRRLLPHRDLRQGEDYGWAQGAQ